MSTGGRATDRTDFEAACRAYAAAKRDARVGVKERRALYEACVEKGTALGMSRYAIEEAIELHTQIFV